MSEARELVVALAAAPRGAGTRSESRARDFCATYLKDLGFRVHLEPFSFSAFVGAWATPVAGGLVASMFVLVGWMHATQQPEHMPFIVTAHVAALSVLLLLSTGSGILGLGLLRLETANLVAEPHTAEPRVWLVAHLDSKSQPVAILTRAMAVALVVAASVAVIVVLALGSVGIGVPRVLPIACVVGVIASVPLVLCTVGDASHGALDNASGVAAVLLAARQLVGAGVRDFGVVITSGEELALAGAHALAASRAPAIALNCDSVDDRGSFYCIGGHRSSSARKALVAAGKQNETKVRARRRLIGILEDSMALRARGWDAVTLSRGSMKSLSRIHTPDDLPEALAGQGVTVAAALLASATATLRGHPQ